MNDNESTHHESGKDKWLKIREKNGCMTLRTRRRIADELVDEDPEFDNCTSEELQEWIHEGITDEFEMIRRCLGNMEKLIIENISQVSSENLREIETGLENLEESIVDQICKISSKYLGKSYWRFDAYRK